MAVGHADQVSYVRKPHRGRVLLAVVPVIAAGGAVLAVTLAPHQPATGDRPSARGTPSSSVAASPSRPASAAPPSKGTSSASPAPPDVADADAPAPAPGPHGPGSRAPVLPRSPEPTAPRPTTGGGSHAHPKPAPLSPNSRSQLENAKTGQCVAGAGTFLSIGTCDAGYAYAWTLRSTGGNTFELVNRASGSCLTAPPGNDYQASLTNCTYGNIHWRIDTTSAAGQTLKSVETDHCLKIDSPPFSGTLVMVTTCNSDDKKQLWRGNRTS
ncbi:RICIN domain-containing protein [Streptomyces sp. NPDC050617]|uniref:RICIN domain-containing protein n=1 Tax=Streptomyces sp. NPDC050617 TaxID=3154628 RepID=UPI00341E1554